MSRKCLVQSAVYKTEKLPHNSILQDKAFCLVLKSSE